MTTFTSPGTRIIPRARTSLGQSSATAIRCCSLSLQPGRHLEITAGMALRANLQNPQSEIPATGCAIWCPPRPARCGFTATSSPEQPFAVGCALGFLVRKGSQSWANLRRINPCKTLGGRTVAVLRPNRVLRAQSTPAGSGRLIPHFPYRDEAQCQRN
jgi:hypothetical protein